MKEIDELIELKKIKNISYEKIAAQIGVSYQTVLRWMKKKNVPSDLALIQIRKFIGKNK